MQLPVMTFSSVLEQMAAGLQGAASQLLDLSVGSVLRSLLESCAAIALWLQWLTLQVFTATRAATSQGADLDSWMADFSFARSPGTQATGSVTFARYTPGINATIPVGTIVLSLDGTSSFVVTADPSNSAWNNGSYILAATLSAIEVPIAAVAFGSAGNVLAGSIGLIAAPLSGIDTVSNAMPLSGGMDAETDAALRSRFQLYINSLSLATKLAVEFAVTSIRPISRYLVLENQDPTGARQLGNFCVFADDGSGAPPAALLKEVQSAVEMVRPIGTTFSVLPPSVYEANIAVALESSNPATHAAIAASAQSAIATWIAGLPIGGILSISKLDAIAHSIDPSVISVTSTLINSEPVDLVAPPTSVIVAQTILVS